MNQNGVGMNYVKEKLPCNLDLLSFDESLPTMLGRVASRDSGISLYDSV
jgi:hypothetical protein